MVNRITLSRLITDPIFSESETAEVTGLSPSNLGRMNKRGDGPTRVQLSPRRVGSRLHNVEEWLASRTPGSAQERGK
jgi:predicted DNA-binding transcriptional regulator AlpA